MDRPLRTETSAFDVLRSSVDAASVTAACAAAGYEDLFGKVQAAIVCPVYESVGFQCRSRGKSQQLPHDPWSLIAET